jgi:hypothetical protein
MLCVILLFCASVVQGSGAFVTLNDGEVTLFPMAQSITLLAHNNLQGRRFSEIEVGDAILYLDDNLDNETAYVVTEIVDAQASDTLSEQTKLFIDGEWMSVEQSWRRVGYFDADKLVLQTCTYEGRLFVIAEPATGE